MNKTRCLTVDQETTADCCENCIYSVISVRHGANVGSDEELMCYFDPPRVFRDGKTQRPSVDELDFCSEFVSYPKDDDDDCDCFLCSNKRSKVEPFEPFEMVEPCCPTCGGVVCPACGK